MSRCLQTSFLSLTSSSGLLLIVMFALAICYQLRSNFELRELLRQEQLRVQNNKMEYSKEISRVMAESREKDNRTQEIYNLKGLCENQLADSRKHQTEAEHAMSQTEQKLDTYLKNNKVYSEDLKQLR